MLKPSVLIKAHFSTRSPSEYEKRSGVVVEAFSCSSSCPAASWLAPSCLKTRGSPVLLMSQ